MSRGYACCTSQLFGTDAPNPTTERKKKEQNAKNETYKSGYRQFVLWKPFLPKSLTARRSSLIAHSLSAGQQATLTTHSHRDGGACSLCISSSNNGGVSSSTYPQVWCRSCCFHCVVFRAPSEAEQFRPQRGCHSRQEACGQGYRFRHRKDLRQGP